MQEFIPVLIHLNPGSDLFAQISAFQRQARELNEFIGSVKWGMQHSNVDRTNEHRPVITGSLPDDLVLEGLYRRYRFFILQKEKSNYRRLVNALSQSSESAFLHLYCRMAKKEFLEEDILKFAFLSSRSPVTPEELIDYWFNAYYFHDDRDKHEKLERFSGIVSDNGSKVALWHVVWNSTLRIKNFSYLLSDTSEENPQVHVPVVSSI